MKGSVHSKFLPPDTTVKSVFFCDVLSCLRENLQRERRNFGTVTIGSSSQQCAHPHVPKTKEFVTNSMVISPRPPYSPDLGPCDCALFPKLKMKLKVRRFETLSDVQRESHVVLDTIKENDFHIAFEVWKKW
jgi:hypothetical protein